MKTLLVALLMLGILMPYYAQAANQKVNCTVSCKIGSDAFPTTGVQPTQCSLYKAGVLFQTAPVVPASPAGVACLFTITLPNGTYSFTATALAADGSESAQSSPPLVFDSSAGPPPPPSNVRIVP